MAEKTANGFNLSKDKTAIYGKDIITPLSKIAFANNLVTPSASKAGTEPKFSCSFLFGKNDPKVQNDVKALQEMCKLMIVDLFGARAGEIIKTFKPERKMFRDGDSPSNSGKLYEGYAGNWIIVAKNKFPEGHYRGFQVLGKLASEIQSGMTVRGVVQPYLNQDGFSWQLRTVKFVADDGTRFAGAPDPSSLLDNLDDAIAATSNSAVSIDLTDL